MSNLPPVNLRRLQEIHHQLMRNDVRYLLGGKVSLTADPNSIRRLDCSSLVRYLIYQSTTPQLAIPDGSWIQRQWCLDHGLKRVKYEAVNVGEDDATLFLAFLDPKGGKAGHVWFVCRGFTMESRGGQGPDERRWDTPFLRREVDYCFVLEHIWK